MSRPGGRRMNGRVFIPRRGMLALLGATGAAWLAGCSNDDTRSSAAMPAQASGTIWTERAPLLAPNSETAVAELDGNIYVIGGYPSTRVYVDTVQVYDSRTDSWSYTTALPRSMHHTMAAATNGRVYVIGGEMSRSGIADQGIFLNTVYEYDPATATWTERTAMPTARSGGATGVIDGKIYVAGGRPPGGHDFAVYDPAADTWTELPDLPTQRNHLAAGVIGGRLYVVGGRFGGGVGSEMTGVVEVYDPSSNNWTRAAPMPTARGGVNGIAARGCFYAFGGEGNDADPRGVFAENEVYDPRAGSWRRLDPIPTPVHGVAGAAYLNGWIHLPGGGTARGGNSGSTLHQAFQAVMDCE